ncbi:MAG: hypothetical protein P8M11_15770 [Planctomycetota bacterium]|nr:hypothetical protein [Planctomycetota bacterium]
MLSLAILTSLVPAAQAGQQLAADDIEGRLSALEADRDRLAAELNAAMDALADAEVGGAPSSEIDADKKAAWETLASRNLAPRASAVYSADGLSFGGYGEFLGEAFRNKSGDKFDALRWVMYFGSRFSDDWIFNSEIEIEHGTTGATSATTDSAGSVSVEFAYIDHLLTNNTALRGGIVLVPLGFINERHEPTTFMASARPETEKRIIPSTWRSTGIGGYGQVGGFAWTGYAINGLNGEEFDASGVRSGRQKGNRASIDTVALTGRLDYIAIPGVTVGASIFHGNSGVTTPEDLSTTIWDIHGEWNEGPWTVRGLYANSDIDDTAAFNTRTGENLAEQMRGWYLEAGYDLFSFIDAPAGQSLDVFVRYEDLDTQAKMATGFSPNGGKVDTYTTVGLNYRPLDQVVLKTDYTMLDEGDDVYRFLIGYAF